MLVEITIRRHYDIMIYVDSDIPTSSNSNTKIEYSCSLSKQFTNAPDLTQNNYCLEQ